MDTPSNGRARGIALAALWVSLLLVAAAYGSAFVTPSGAGWSIPAFAAGACGTMGAMMALGAARHGRLDTSWAPMAITIVLVAAGLLIVWALPAAGEPMWFGLPRRAAIVLYGVGVLPAVLLPLIYAWSFDRFTLRAEDLDRIRRLRSDAAGSGDADDGGAGP
jgi:hypothetical protein